MRPVFVKLGGSVLTDKAQERSFQRGVARRLVSEVRKAEVPIVLFHGAGSFGHPPAERGGLGRDRLTGKAPAVVSETMAGVLDLHNEMVQIAAKAGLRPLSIPLHLTTRSEAGIIEGLPVQRIQALMADGFTPVLTGTAIRDDELGWRVASADELMAELAPELEPRLAIFASDVEGVLDGDGQLLPTLASVEALIDYGVAGADVTGGIVGKVRRAMTIAETCPTLVLNGAERGRLLDALKGKAVPATRFG